MPFLAPLVPLAAGAIGAAASGGGGSSDAAPDPAAAAARANGYQWGGYGAGQGELNDDGTAYLPGSGKPHHTVYHGSGADDATARYQGLANGWANQAAPTTDYSADNQSRAGAMDALGMIHDRATGAGPSVAAGLMRQGENAAEAAQVQGAAGARGQAGIAQAGALAQGNIANSATQNIANTGLMRSKEIMDAQNQLLGGYSNMRGLDQGRAQYLSNLAEQQRQLNQGGQLGFEGLGYNVQNAQLGANAGKTAADDAHWATQMGADQASKDRLLKGIGIGADTLKSGIQAAAA